MKFSLKPTLSNETVTLRPFREEDIPVMLKLLTMPNVNNLTGVSDTFLTENIILPDDVKQKTIEWYKTRNSQQDRLDLAIEYSGVVVGEVVINLYDEIKNQANFRVLISDDYVNKGIGSNALTLLLPYVFNELELSALTLDVFEFNPRASHVYKKVGFEEIGRLKNEIEVDGQNYDSIEMILTQERYKALY
jgi:diamine N-acetyltransferase